MMCIWLCKPIQQTHLNSPDDIQLVWATRNACLFFPSLVLKLSDLLCTYTKARTVAPNSNPGRVGTRRE